jgi:hypothetical protein
MLMKRARLLAAMAVATFLVLPSLSFADASVVQDSCFAFENGGKIYHRIYFTVVNFSLPTNVCDLHFIPEPLPVPPECELVGSGQPLGWSSFLSPLGGADWFANTPGDCIAPGTAKGGFWFVLDPGFCCYVVQFTDPTGAVVLEQEECFTLCEPVGAEAKTWGQVKARYR